MYYKIEGIKGLKKAVGDYQRATKGGHYCRLMLNLRTSEVWVDNYWQDYADDNIYDLGEFMEICEWPVNMQNVKVCAVDEIHRQNQEAIVWY